MKLVATGVVHNVPKDLQEMLLSQPNILEIWNNALTPLARNEWICYVTIVKKAETRAAHIVRLQEDLLRGKKRPCCWQGCPHRSTTAA